MRVAVLLSAMVLAQRLGNHAISDGALELWFGAVIFGAVLDFGEVMLKMRGRDV